jgi:hypothetical protein
MAADSLPPEIRALIAQHIRAVEQLEILCLFSEHPEKVWSVGEVYRQIQSSERSVSEWLEHFRAAGMLVNSGSERTYRLAHENTELKASVAALARAYRERHVSVIECIYHQPPDAIQDFAAAFKLKKDK